MKKFDLCSTYFVSVVQTPNTCLGRLIVEVHRSHTPSMNSSERVISASQMQLATKHSTNTRNQLPCLQRYSNPQFQQSSGCILMPQTTRPAGMAYFKLLSPVKDKSIHDCDLLKLINFVSGGRYVYSPLRATKPSYVTDSTKEFLYPHDKE